MKNRVRELRTEAGLSQDALAEQLGVSRQTVISIEVERYNPSLTLAFKIADQFGTTVEEVFRVDNRQPADAE
jgi:putative transcriptional regulator